MLKISKAALFAAMLSLGAASTLGILPVAAQETASPATSVTTTLSIPAITAIQSSMDEAALRDALTGGFLKHVDELAKLNAASITIPEITLTITSAGVTQTMSYKDIVLSDVKDGVAGTARIGSSETTSPDGSFKFGVMSAAAIDVGAILALYSLVEGGDANAPMKTLYRDFVFEGGTFSGPEATCTVGKVTTASFDARPLKISFNEMIAAAEKLEAMEDNPPPEAIATVVGFITDIFSAFQSTPLTMDGMSCTGADDRGDAFAFSVGGLTMDGYAPGIYPALSISDLKIEGGEGEDTGAITLGSATIKTIDLQPTIDGLAEGGTDLTEQWFEANWRKLIPAVGGFAFSDLAVDIPNPDSPSGPRIVAKIGSFDLSLSEYFNGIPTRISTSAVGVDFPLPQDTTDPQVAMLLAAGLTNINMGFDVSASWDRNAKTIVVDKVALSGADLGSIAIALTVGNASEQLFDLNPNIALASSFGVTVKNVTIDLADSGLGNIAWPLMASEEGISDVAGYRTQLAGVAEGLALQLLGSTDSARQLGVAIGDFVTGKASALTINIASKDPNGVAFPLFMAAAEDPTVLAGQVDVTGSAK